MRETIYIVHRDGYLYGAYNDPEKAMRAANKYSPARSVTPVPINDDRLPKTDESDKPSSGVKWREG